ncbi:MAG: SH3 domain-containing protein, partial [Zetaproteobacteria bacterium]|nr:SH3 domain-containing protein [Zetaproteobacteria bacterium]
FVLCTWPLAEAPRVPEKLAKHYITGNHVHIRKGPGTQYKSVGFLHKQAPVVIFEKQGTWARIGAQSEWVSTTYIRAKH